MRFLGFVEVAENEAELCSSGRNDSVFGDDKDPVENDNLKSVLRSQTIMKRQTLSPRPILALNHFQIPYMKKSTK